MLVAVPALASTKPDHGRLSPAIAALVEKRTQLKAASERLDAQAGDLDDANKARGIVDLSEVFRIEKRSTELLQQFWELMYDMLEIPAASLADLGVQIEALVEDSTIVGDLSSFDVDNGGVEFLQRLPSEISRLAGVS